MPDQDTNSNDPGLSPPNHRASAAIPEQTNIQRGGIRFQPKQAGLVSVQVWEYDAPTRRTSRDVAGETIQALSAPDDFPPIESAIVAGDRVALAVDPNVPNVDEVVRGAIRMIRSTPADQIEVVVWEEATSETLARIKVAAGDCPVISHQSDHRDSLCYLAADVDAEPIYLNRALVDADFVLPIVAVRPTNVSQRRDVTGVFPSLSDSATRTRFGDKVSAGVAANPAMKSGNTIAEEVPWLLGIQLVVTVTANASGTAGEIRAGTIEAIAKRIIPTLRRPDPVPPPAALVIAALDGDEQQQTWENVVRAADAATAYAEPDATIVIWSSLSEPPAGALLALDSDFDGDDFNDDFADRPDERDTDRETDSDGLPTWNRFSELARVLKRVTENHRVLLHSRLDRETIEPIGIGVIESAAELANLSRNFESCGVLRAASFAGGN
ncbi:MAG: hypothetical protein KDB00_17260 [Planctomycetales bacterium]|nr:hypothetical protein [Planctomycetales bacterium]